MATEQEIERALALLQASLYDHFDRDDITRERERSVTVGLGPPSEPIVLHVDLGNRVFWDFNRGRVERSQCQPFDEAIERDRAITLEEDRLAASDIVQRAGYSASASTYNWSRGHYIFGYGAPESLNIELRGPKLVLYADLLAREMWSNGFGNGWILRSIGKKKTKKKKRKCNVCDGTGEVTVRDGPVIEPPMRRIFLQEEAG